MENPSSQKSTITLRRRSRHVGDRDNLSVFMPSAENDIVQNFHRYRTAASVLLIIVLCVLFFASMIGGHTVAGYRDSASLYYPMFRWIDGQMAAGHLPLWMPFDNSGFPLLADGTSSLLYPGKLIFQLRILPFASRYGIYLAGHVLLAAASTLLLARRLGASHAGAALAAISYAFGGSLLFQVHNVIYLVSGSWLPVALLGVWNMSPDAENNDAKPGNLSTRICGALLAASACVMMILGGDPQMVYHVGLIAAVTTGLVILKRFFAARRQWNSQPSKKQPGLKVWLPLLPLVVLVAATSTVAAVQLLPTIEWSKHSGRSMSGMPTNIYQSAAHALRGQSISGAITPLAAEPEGPPMTDVYQFSLEPWSVVELVFSGCLGQEAAVNTRWTNSFPGAERVWMPSIYFGCITLFLSLAGMRLWTHSEGRRPDVWLTWIAIAFGLAALGWYGPIWLLREWLSENLQPQSLDGMHSPVGGIYWLMATLLPGYSNFRYPAKLWMVASLAISLLAGRKLELKRLIFLRPAWASLLFISLAGLICSFTPWLASMLDSCRHEGSYGSFDPAAMLLQIQFSFAKTAILAIVMLGGGWIFRRGSPTSNNPRLANWHGLATAFVVLIVAIDLTVSNLWMLHPVEATVFNKPSAIEEQIQRDRQSAGLDVDEILVLSRAVTMDGLTPDSDEGHVSLADFVCLERESVFPKTHLDIANVQMQGSFCSIMPRAYDSPQAAMPVPDGTVQREGSDNDSGNGNWYIDWFKNPTPIATVTAGKQTSTARVHWRDNGFFIDVTQPTQQHDPEKTLTMRLLPMPGWTASCQLAGGNPSEATRVVATGPLEVSMVLPDDTTHVRMKYRPASFRIGAWISGVSLLFWLIVAIALLLASRRRPTNP